MQDYFGIARPALGNPLLARFQKVAAELRVVLPISFYERSNNAYFNSVAMIDADGSNLGIYRKTHIPQGPGYQEKYYFSPGDTGFRVFRTAFACVGVGICWDQWFPETARCLALAGAELLLFPTAIGSEPQDPTIDSSAHWRRTMQGHSAANIIPVIASNRIGREVFQTRVSAVRAAGVPTPPPGAMQAQQVRGLGLAAAPPPGRPDGAKTPALVNGPAVSAATGTAAGPPEGERTRGVSTDAAGTLMGGANGTARPDATAVTGQVVNVGGTTITANGHRPAEDGSDSLAFYGGAFITDQWGEVVVSTGRDEDRSRSLPTDGVITLPEGSDANGRADAAAGGAAPAKSTGAGPSADVDRTNGPTADSLTFYGSSFITDQWGDVVVSAGRDEEAILSFLFDLDVIVSDRRQWGLFRDRRPEMYGALMSMDGNAAASGGAGTLGVPPGIHGPAPVGAAAFLPAGGLSATHSAAVTAAKQQQYASAAAAAAILPLTHNRQLGQVRPPYIGPTGQLFPGGPAPGHSSQMGALMHNQQQRADGAPPNHGGLTDHHAVGAVSAGVPVASAAGLLAMQPHNHPLGPGRGPYTAPPNQLYGAPGVANPQLGALLLNQPQPRGDAPLPNGHAATAAAGPSNPHTTAAAAAAAAAEAVPAASAVVSLPLQAHALAPPRASFAPPSALFPGTVPGAPPGSLLLPGAPGVSREEDVGGGDAKTPDALVPTSLAPSAAAAAAASGVGAEQVASPTLDGTEEVVGGGPAGGAEGSGSGTSDVVDPVDATNHEASFIGEVRDTSQRRPRGRCWSCRAKTTYECKKCVPGPVPLCNRVPRECWWKYHAGEVTPFVPSRRGRKRKNEDGEMPLASPGDAVADYGSGGDGGGDSGGSAGADASIGDIGTNDGDDSLADARVVA